MPPTEQNIQSKIVLKYFLVVVFLSLGFASYFFGSQSADFSHPASERFTGVLDHVSGNSLYLKGNFVVNDELYSKSKDTLVAEAIVTPETKFNVTVYYQPTDEELAKTNGNWDLKTVKKEVIAGSLSDLASTTSVVSVTTNENVFGKTQFTVSTVNYNVLKLNKSKFAKEVCEDAEGNHLSESECKKKTTTTTRQ